MQFLHSKNYDFMSWILSNFLLSACPLLYRHNFDPEKFHASWLFHQDSQKVISERVSLIIINLIWLRYLRGVSLFYNFLKHINLRFWDLLPHFEVNGFRNEALNHLALKIFWILNSTFGNVFNPVLINIHLLCLKLWSV